MPFIEVNATQLYYETYGADQPGRAPLLLIHGSTITGQADWGALAPLLARDYRVIVPDCRGHGRSPNPRLSYSFSELAADLAGLIRALGYERAHVVGHSNGGNVALVMLLEQPEVVQTCIPQAANAYVSPDLLEREPPLFDPERVARDKPEWMREMIELHGPYLGPDYWRDLLRLTLHAILTEPNYTPADLARVNRPTLVIQGAQDPVNAPAGHAQFIAEHIPAAEQWIPDGVGHNVHLDRPLAWLERVLDFLRRRGDDVNEALERLRQARWADGRGTVFAPRAEAGQLTGRVLTAEQAAAARQAAPGLTDEVRILLQAETPWALVRRAVTDVRAEPRRLSERWSQALLGEPVRLLETSGDWVYARVERDGYLGWIQRSTLVECSAEAAQAYPADGQALVLGGLAPAYAAPDGRTPIGKLPVGARLPLVEQRGDWLALRLPTGEVGWTLAEHIRLPQHQYLPNAAGRGQLLTHFEGHLGVPYLWGGITPFGFDCSGLAQTFWRCLGVRLPRDADQQMAALPPVAGPPQAGDLFFFGENGARRRVTHVGLALDAVRMLHSNGHASGVSIDPVAPGLSDYSDWLHAHCLGVGRARP